MKEETYTDEDWCGHCQTDTRQKYYCSGHERDSSGNSQTCLVCGWSRRGHGSEWWPPIADYEMGEEAPRGKKPRGEDPRSWEPLFKNAYNTAEPPAGMLAASTATMPKSDEAVKWMKHQKEHIAYLGALTLWVLPLDGNEWGWRVDCDDWITTSVAWFHTVAIAKTEAEKFARKIAIR